MSAFPFIFLCLQAYFIQNVFSQYYGTIGQLNGYGLGYGNALSSAVPLSPGFAPYGLATSYAPPFSLAPMAAEFGGLGIGMAPPIIELGVYGGDGFGDVAVIGEMPVTGTTDVAGQVPILGAVRFAGDLPATGTISITGSCGCGCRSYY